MPAIRSPSPPSGPIASPARTAARASSVSSRASGPTISNRWAVELDNDANVFTLAQAEAAQRAGQLAQAIAGYLKVLDGGLADETAAKVHYNLGKALAGLERFDDAAEHYECAIALDETLTEAYLDLGITRQEQGRALEAIAVYRRLLVLGPNARALVNIGGLLHNFGQFGEAETCLRLATQLAPDLAEGWNNLGNIYSDQGFPEKAAEHYRRAAELSDQPALHSSLLFALCFVESADPDEVYREHLRYNERFIAPLRDRRRKLSNSRDPERRLRIGYLSPDFRRHPGGHMLLPMFVGHDKAQFEIVAYSNSSVIDDRTRDIQGRAATWRPCANLSDDALADLIVADGIDILVECAGHMAGTRLPMCGLKPAPIIVSFPLYPNTTGVETVDYRIMDPYFAPEWAERWHSETLIRMPDVHVGYAPLPEDIAPADPPPCVTNGYVTLGSFNNLAKIGPTTVAVWSRILREVPTARLRLKWHGVRPGADWVSERFTAHGIDAARIELAEYTPHPYTGYRDLDICLDPLGSNGGTTTCDALWMGVPVVSKFGRTPFSRAGLSFLTNAGLSELVTDDVDRYVAIAKGLATDRERLLRLRRGLRERFAASPIMDSVRYTRHLEAEFRRIWRVYCEQAHIQDM